MGSKRTCLLAVLVAFFGACRSPENQPELVSVRVREVTEINGCAVWVSGAVSGLAVISFTCEPKTPGGSLPADPPLAGFSLNAGECIKLNDTLYCYESATEERLLLRATMIDDGHRYRPFNAP